jgi:hypothetical protein
MILFESLSTWKVMTLHTRIGSSKIWRSCKIVTHHTQPKFEAEEPNKDNFQGTPTAQKQVGLGGEGRNV